jgi:hypothetical protein
MSPATLGRIVGLIPTRTKRALSEARLSYRIMVDVRLTPVGLDSQPRNPARLVAYVKGMRRPRFLVGHVGDDEVLLVQVGAAALSSRRPTSNAQSLLSAWNGILGAA